LTETIESDDALLRRVKDDPNLWTEKGGELRVSSAAMSPHPEDQALSVDVRRLIPDPRDPLTAPSVVAGEVADGVVELFARAAERLGLAVKHEPLPENYAHADITGFDQMRRKEAKRAQRELAKTASWVREPVSAAQT